MEWTTIEVEVKGGVAYLWLNRPEVRNALNEVVIAQITQALEMLDADASVRAVVLGGRGRAFCAGADLHWMKKTAGYSAAQNQQDALALARMLRTLRNLGKPTIARVNGPAYAGGMGLVCTCDLAVVSSDASFCLSEVRIGLVPATISPYVLEAMGVQAAKRYMLTAEILSAQDAVRLGIAQEVSAPESMDATVDQALAWLMRGGPEALKTTKQMIASVARAPLDEDLSASMARLIADVRASPEGMEGVASYLEKRAPRWQLPAPEVAA